ncbi:MAG TPA: nitrilase-related carbon-nitrogen hydrolase [Phycisphaerales bacterium]|nr:nitrilase-related carbon-nitrogen hydrolase [Phycisphaerales bacterium]HRQ74900.1 nitrilase-related carbon-nitrogen hydrolase [Phycisphaerales bacterium]
MRFAAVQFDIVWENKPANHAIVERMIDEAQPAIPRGAFVLLPELGDTGFSFNLDRIVDDRSLTWARELARTRSIWLQHGFAQRGEDQRGRNCAAIIAPTGDVIGHYEKVHPFSFGREVEHYTGGDHQLIARCGEMTVCPAICYDLRFPELWRLGALGGAQAFTIGASWPAARQHHWRSLLIARAIENQAYVVAVNRVGNDPHLPYAGGSMIVSPMGEILAEAGESPAVIQADLDPAALNVWRSKFPALADIHRNLLGEITTVRPT